MKECGGSRAWRKGGDISGWGRAEWRRIGLGREGIRDSSACCILTPSPWPGSPTQASRI